MRTQVRCNCRRAVRWFAHAAASRRRSREWENSRERRWWHTIYERLDGLLATAHALEHVRDGICVGFGPSKYLVGKPLHLLKVVSAHLKPRLVRVGDHVRVIFRTQHDRISGIFKHLRQDNLVVRDIKRL